MREPAHEWAPAPLQLATTTTNSNGVPMPYLDPSEYEAYGFTTPPSSLKSACAQVVRNAQATPALNVKGSKVDTLQMQYFSGSLIDASVQKLLVPYVAQRVG